jgi:WS/DGAT/MGAT family acyltransferase
MLSTDPDWRMQESPLSINTWNRYRDTLKRGRSAPPDNGELRNVLDALKSTFDSGANIYGAARRITRAWTGKDDLLLPFLKVPTSSINTSIAGARRFVAQSWPFARIRAVAKAYDATFNDTVLAMCGGALRQYLINHAELPEESLKAMVPMNVRAEGDLDSSNAVASINADLGTNIADPVSRLAAIQASTEAGKSLFMDMTSEEAQLFTLLLQTPGMLLMPLGLISRMPPFNTVISNVPGIRETSYWNGARMDGSYPVSIVMDGVAMNITLVTYGKNVDFGIIACRRSMPQVQRVIDYMEEALTELEQAAGITWTGTAEKSPARRTATAKVKTRAKTKTSSGAKPKARTQTKTRAKATPKTKAKAMTKTKAKTKTKTKAKPKARAKPKSKPKTTSKSRARPKAKPKAKARPKRR